MAVTRVLISVKTYPILSATYDELVCTAGFREDGSWVRIYPVPYRKLKYADRFKKSFAFEAKLKNWKRAFIQAYRYKWFTHYSYVIMDEAHAKPAIKQVAHFKNHNVGLLTLSVDGNIEIHYRPKKQPRVDPKMQILLSENILYQ